MFHSTAYVNGTVYTMESEGDKCSAFVVQDGKFVYCGSDEEAKKLADEVVDLHGAAVAARLIDTHQHLLAYASGLTKLNLKAAKSLEQLKQMLRDYAKDVPRANGSSVSASTTRSLRAARRCPPAGIWTRPAPIIRCFSPVTACTSSPPTPWR